MSPENYFLIAKVLKVVIIILSVAAVAALLVGTIYLPTRESRRRERKLKELYKSREPLDEHAFYEMFFKSRGISEDSVVKIRRILQDELSLDMSRIVPQDDFTGNLAILWGNFSGLDGLDAVEVVKRFEEEFAITISDAEAASMKTIDDIVRTVSEKVRQQETRTSRIA